MALSSAIANEIKRKASLGIKLTNPTAESTKLYNSFKSSSSPSAPSAPSKPSVPKAVPSSSSKSSSSRTSGMTLKSNANQNSTTISYGDYVKGVNDVEQLKDIYDNAKAAGASQSSLDAIHNRADEIRGYTTDPSRTTRIDNTGNNLPSSGLPITIDPTPTPQPQPQQQPELTYQPPAYTRPDYSGLIKDRFSNLRNSMLAKLRSNKDNALNSYAGAEDIANQEGTTALNQNDVERAKAMQNLRAAMEASGLYGGGENVTGNIGINTTAQQNANLINQDVLKRINEIKAAKDLINKQAADNEVALQNDLNAQETEALLNAADKDYQMSKDAQDRLDKLSQIDTQNNQWQQQFDADQAWKKWQQDFQTQETEWQKNPNNPSIQAQILSNQSALLSNQLAQMQINNYPEEQKLKIQEMIKRIAEIGAAPAMTQYDIDLRKAQIDQIKAETDNIKNGMTKSGGVPSGTQADTNNYWASSAMNELNKLPDYKSKQEWLDQHAQEIIQNSGTSTYNFLKSQIENNNGDTSLWNKLFQ